jgi:hypothetical protein
MLEYGCMLCMLCFLHALAKEHVGWMRTSEDDAVMVISLNWQTF